MLSENILKIISGVFVGIYIARYLGPDQFGLLSYSLAIVSIFMSVSRLGMESILVRDLTKYPDQANAYMGTAFGLMMIASVAGFILLANIIYLLETDPVTQFYILVIAVGILFQALLVIDYRFQSQVKAKYSSISKSIALSVSSIIKVYLVWSQAEILYFAIAYAIDHLIIAIVLSLMYFSKYNFNFFVAFNRKYVKRLLSSAWPMIMSGIAGIVLIRIDQLFIANMLGMNQVGLYAAASKIYEGWMTIIFVITISILPMLIKLKEQSSEIYFDKLQYFFKLLFWSSVLFSIIVSTFSDSIINILFGLQFEESKDILALMVWVSLFTSFGFMSARYLIVEGLQKKIAKRNWIAIMINIPSNYVLIPMLGVNGAVIATMISMFFAHYLLDYLDPDLVELRKIKNSSLLLRRTYEQ